MLSDTAIWVPNGLSQVGLARVCSDSEPSGNPVAATGEMLVCPHWQPNLLVGSVTALSGPLPVGFFFGRAIWGDRPLPTRTCGLFLIFYMIFIYYLRGLGFLVLDISSPF